MREFLESNGYKMWDTRRDQVGEYSCLTQKFQKRVDRETAWLGVWLCECNDKLCINVDLSTTKIGGNESITWSISMTHQSPVNNEWCDLKIYNISTDKLVDIEKFESTLRNMWIAFNKS